MATIDLGRIKFKWQGAYNGATAYVVDDVVSYNGSSYVCILASTGNLPTNTTYWNIMAQKGTDGTDITSLAGLAQGDILYYNGTDWVRLGAGTSGQVLQTGGSGANPSWATVSSDYVKLYSGTLTSGSSLALSNIFTTDYKVYKLNIIQYVAANGSTDSFRLRFRNVNNDEVTSGYYWAKAHPMANSGTSGINAHSGYNDNHIKIMDNGVVGAGTNGAKGYSAEITINDPRDSSRYTSGLILATYMNASNTQYSSYAGGFHNEVNAEITGLTIYENVTSFSYLNYAVYGIK